MEACGLAHYWARTLQSVGHEVKLIATQFVRPFVKTNKTAIRCENYSSRTGRGFSALQDLSTSCKQVPSLDFQLS